MDKQAVLLFGCGELQQSIAKRAQKMGLFVVGIDPCADAACKDDMDAFEVVGGQDFEGTLAVARKYNVRGIVTAATDKPLVMMARVAKELNLPFYSVETAQWSTDKFQMKQRFMEGGVPCAQGRLIHNADEAKDLYFPVICKPRDNSGSRGVKLCRNLQELQACIDEALQYSKLDTVLVEEFIEGREFSIESLHYNGKSEVIQFTEKKTTPFPYNVELGHKQPANLTDGQRDAIREIVSKISVALKFENCPSHTELKVNERGIFVIETSPRLGGDYITSTLTPLSTGINMEDQLLHISLGEKVDTKTGRVEKASGVCFFDFPEGKVVKIDHEIAKVGSWPRVYAFNLKLKEGDTVGKITSSLNRYGEFIVSGENREEVDDKIDIYKKSVIDGITLNHMKQLKGKRLLVLGGSMWKEEIKRIADDYGIYLISAGLYPAEIDKIADEVYHIDTIDASIMKHFIIEHKVDGVYLGGSELIINGACEYINELGLPCYCTKQTWDLLQDKSKFKALCMKFGLPCVPRYSINSEAIDFPVITKPTDGCGSNGFSVCKNEEELITGYEFAKKASPTGSVLIEKFVKNDSVVVFYTFSEGKLLFSGLENKYPVKYTSHESYVAGMHLFESRYATEFRERFDEKLEKMFQSIGIKEGSLWIEVFHDGDNYFFNEVGFRYSGSVSIYPIDYFYGINQVGADIYYALTGKSMVKGHRTLIAGKVPHKKYYCIYNVHMLPGVIAKIEGVEEFRALPECVFIADRKHEGDTVNETGTVAQVFAFVHFVFDSIDECHEIVEKLYNTMHVTDTNGKELIHNMINWEERNVIV